MIRSCLPHHTRGLGRIGDHASMAWWCGWQDASGASVRYQPDDLMAVFLVTVKDEPKRNCISKAKWCKVTV